MQQSVDEQHDKMRRRAVVLSMLRCSAGCRSRGQPRTRRRPSALWAASVANSAARSNRTSICIESVSVTPDRSEIHKTWSSEYLQFSNREHIYLGKHRKIFIKQIYPGAPFVGFPVKSGMTELVNDQLVSREMVLP